MTCCSFILGFALNSVQYTRCKAGNVYIEVYNDWFLFQSVTTKDVTSGKVTKAAEKAQKKK